MPPAARVDDAGAMEQLSGGQTAPDRHMDDPGPGGFGRGAAVMLAWFLAVVVLWGLAVLLAPDHNASGQCEGIGFGCVLTPRDTVALAGLILGAPGGIAALVAGLLALTAFTQLRVRNRLSARPVLDGTLAAATGVAAAALLAPVVVFTGLGLG